MRKEGRSAFLWSLASLRPCWRKDQPVAERVSIPQLGKKLPLEHEGRELKINQREKFQDLQNRKAELSARWKERSNAEKQKKKTEEIFCKKGR